MGRPAMTARWQEALQRGWMGWRLRALAALALIGCLGLFALLRVLAQSPHLAVQFQASSPTVIELVATGHTELRPHLNQHLVSIGSTQHSSIIADPSLLRRAPRFVVDDLKRLGIQAQQSALAQLALAPEVSLVFEGGHTVRVMPMPRGFGGLGALFWLLSSLALVLYLIAVAVFFSRPGVKNLLYAVMACSQSCNLIMMAIEALPGWGLPIGLADTNLWLRTVCDLVTVAAILQAFVMHPVPLRNWSAMAATGWLVALSYAGLVLIGGVASQWWWTQALLLGYSIAALLALTLSRRHEPHPASLVLRRIGVAATVTLTLLTLSIALADDKAQTQHLIATIGSVIWYVFFASLLLLVPFLSRSQHVMREFAMLAGFSTVATSLDLLFITIFAFGQFTSLTLALFVSLALYAGARQWIMSHLTGKDIVSVERTFECLYRAARAVESSPQHTLDHVGRLLLDLFEPLEVRRIAREARDSIVAANGSMLVVPLPAFAHLRDTLNPAEGAYVLRYARRGRRLFTLDDARLANRVLEQLRSAVAYDRAVEQGRSEERTRLAQDLHDDIGARLLTLMYKAPTPEMEEYLRHTLQDLKTLTRGLASQDHLLTNAVGEWKVDISQRLAASHCELHWAFRVDADVNLNVVQWSGITRILRELVNNVIAHANATRVEVDAVFERGALRICVSDDGHGKSPASWSHGLGLGGVRKRARVLGGQVQWTERQPQGIQCEVRIPRIAEGRR